MARTSARHYVFDSTPAVRAARERGKFLPCPACGIDASTHQFHQRGVRFVRCSACASVYASPAGGSGRNYFDVERMGQHQAQPDREAFVADFDALLQRLAERYRAAHGRAPRGVVVAGRSHADFETSATARQLGLRRIALDDAAYAHFRDTGEAPALLEGVGDAELVVLYEMLEASVQPAELVRALATTLGEQTWVAVVYANLLSLPARMLRRHWPHFFDHKSVYFNRENLGQLFWRTGFAFATQLRMPTRVSLGYAAERLGARMPDAARKLPVDLPTGLHVAVFRPRAHHDEAPEKLSILFPCYNEARTVRDVLEALLAKELPIDKELVIVESNSSDGTRDIVREYEGRPGVRVIYEERPQGKGHAVKTGLAHATGSIVLIQDADFEYDLDDYEALLDPILQRRTSFVLGSRSLGLDDWKVRKYASTPVKGFLLNFAQVVFAETFNALYQQNTTDVNTMFKVFRRECLDGVELESDGFNLDIELVCKIVKSGYSPMEVPVNYVARGFEDGKKISFVRDALPSYWAFFKFRFGND